MTQTLTVLPVQAQTLAHAVAARDAAQAAFLGMLHGLASGHVPDGAALADINTDTGTLTFHVAPGAPDAG